MLNSSLDVGHGLAMRLDVLHVIVDLDVECWFVDHNPIVWCLHQLMLVQHTCNCYVVWLCHLLWDLRVSS